MNIDAKIKEILNNIEFIKQLFTLRIQSEVQELFERNGINIKKDELEIIGKYLLNCVEYNGKVPEFLLQQVSAGTSENSSTQVNLGYRIARIIGEIFSTPFITLGYTIGATPAGFIRGLINGAKETWYGYRCLMNTESNKGG